MELIQAIEIILEIAKMNLSDNADLRKIQIEAIHTLEDFAFNFAVNHLGDE